MSKPEDTSPGSDRGRRHKVGLSFFVDREEDDGTETRIFEVPSMRWLDVPEYGAVALEYLMNKFLEGANKFGIRRCTARGQGDQLEELIGKLDE